MQRWPHQVRAVKDILSCVDQGMKRMCYTSVTGSGKSTVIQDLCQVGVQRDWPVAVFSNRKLLTMQLVRGLDKAGIHVGVRAAEFEAWTDHNAPVQVCSTPTEISRVLGPREKARKRLATEDEVMRNFKLFPSKFVIVDEPHINKGSRMQSILDELERLYGAVIVSVTATPLGIGRIYKHLILGCNMSEGRKCGALVPAYGYEPEVVDVIRKVYRSKDELPSQDALEAETRRIWTQHIVGSVFRNWKRYNENAKPGLGFAPGVKESLGLAREFYARGVNSAHIDGTGMWINGKEYKSTKQEDRDELFAMSKDGKLPMLFSRMVLREAVDMPWIETMVLATPIPSLLSFIQICGRGLRASPSTGKDRCLIIDHCGNIQLHQSPNIDRDWQWKLYFNEDENKVTRDRVNELRDPLEENPSITCPQCHLIRLKGPKCPGCGFEHTQSVRYIIQEDGELKRSTDSFLPKRNYSKKVKRDKVQQLWEACFWRCKKSKKREFTFAQVRALFAHENQYYPPDGLPYMPKNSMDWTRKINDVKWDRLVPKRRLPEPEPEPQPKKGNLFDE